MAGKKLAEVACKSNPPSRKRPRDDELLKGESLEVQQNRCRSARYKDMPRCRSCVANRQEQCRFRFMRLIAVDVKQGRPTRAVGSFDSGRGYRLNCVQKARGVLPRAFFFGRGDASTLGLAVGRPTGAP